VRINLGLFQHDVNVIWDLAPHDLSIVCHLLQSEPRTVHAVTAKHAGAPEYLAYLHLVFDNDVVAHFHLNWLSPVKIRRTLIAGTNKMVVYDDLESTEKVKVYDKGIVVKEKDPSSVYKALVDYRSGDMVAPKLEHREALAIEAEHFVQCIQRRTQPLADGRAGLRVVRILEAAQMSIARDGARVDLEEIECKGLI
jgi:predicted dehydrogenase